MVAERLPQQTAQKWLVFLLLKNIDRMAKGEMEQKGKQFI
jgi:hypothetical protein